MRTRIKTRNGLCATSVLGDTRVRTLTEEAPIRKKTFTDREKELQDRIKAVYHREKYAVKNGKIFILTHYGKGMLGKGVLC